MLLAKDMNTRQSWKLNEFNTLLLMKVVNTGGPEAVFLILQSI
jgi:hypothetical protein